MAPPALALRRRHLATAAMIGVVVYLLVDCVLQFLPPHYDPIREAESNLAVGPFGWIMNLNFLGRAVTTLCAVGALRLVGPASVQRRIGLVLLGAGGMASALLAFLPTDVHVAAGSSAASYSLTGMMHLIVAGTGFVAALLAIVVLTVWSWRTPELAGIAGPAVVCAALTASGGVWLALCATVAPDLLGLAERVCLAGILGWTFVVCAGIRRVSSAGRARG
jgi:hypothetical membrane protein